MGDKVTVHRHIAILGASFVLVSCSGLFGYQGPPVCNEPEGCACTDTGCSCSGVDAGEFAFFGCQMQCQDNCSLACADVPDCEASCGNGCNLTCIDADPGKVECGDNCVLTLVDAGSYFGWGTCGANCQGHVFASTIVVGSNSQVDCAGGTVYCNGPCTVTCSGSCPRGPCAVSCTKGEDPGASHPNGCP